MAEADISPVRATALAIPRHPAAPLIAALPGLLLTAGIAALALALRRLPGLGALSPLILAIVLGILLANTLGTPAAARAGIAFAMRRILRVAIVLIGLQLTLGEVAAVGVGGVAIIAAALVACFLFTVLLGRALGVAAPLARLIAAGTSICGASAVIATNTVTAAPDEDVAYAVACVTLFGSLAMLTYPLLGAALDLAPHAYGLWAGASIHEIAQVAAAAFQAGPEAGQVGTVAKLTRVMMLAPTILALGFIARQGSGAPGASAGAKASPVPWFVLGFVALVAANSVVAVPPAIGGGIAQGTSFLLAMALAGMGLETRVAKLRARGLRPLVLGAASWLFIASLSLVLVHLAL